MIGSRALLLVNPLARNGLHTLLARTLSIPLELRAAADVVVGSKTRRVDLGLVNGHSFFNVATVGLAADLAAGLTVISKATIWSSQLCGCRNSSNDAS